MKKLLLLFSFWPLFVSGQIYIDFESGLSGEWDQFPLNRWECSGAEALSGNQSLQHTFDNSVAGTDIISFKTGIVNTDSLITWEFLLRHAYQPSSSNKWVIMLLSDKPANKMADKENFNAYGFGVNQTNSDDSLRLYFFQNGIPVSGISLGMNFETEAGTGSFHFIVSKDTYNTWVIKGGQQGSSLRDIKEFSLEEKISFKPRYFGVRYTYASTRDRLFWLDDLIINAVLITDTVPPGIINSRVLSGKCIRIGFSEELDTNSVKRENINLFPGNKHPDSIIINGNELKVFFNDGFISTHEYSLEINGIADIEGNNAVNQVLDFIWYEAGLYDLVITEIMADPQPVVYLPDKEYIEIYNRSSYRIDLDSFALTTGSNKWLLPELSINPGGYLLITNQAGGYVFQGINMIPLFTSTAVISNDGQVLSILDKKGKVISAVRFEKGWYDDNYKSEGGWSLERIDINNICGESDNWKASKDPSGGTPGRKNSVADLNPDRVSPRPERVLFHSGNKIEISFSESVNPFTLVDASMYITGNNKILPDSIIPVEPLYKSVVIKYPEILTEGLIYSLKLPEAITDCSGNPLDIKSLVRFGIPTACNFLDVLVSEILFAPEAGCPEFIELYNASGRLLELSDLRINILGNGKTADKIISTGPVLFFPGEYIAITKDRKSLLNCFNCRYPERVIECPDLPVFSNDGACIKILNRSLQTVDEYCYSPNDQFVLISDQNGVSLERIKLDKATGNQSVWHSSSSVSGFGTPGYENSQKIIEDLIKPEFEIQPEIFSPDNDGKDDIMIFSYLLDKEGYTGTACIFDPAGRIVKYMARNEIFGTNGYFSWDGRDESGRICRIGIYLVYMEAFHPSGKVKKYKGTVVLARRF